MQFVRSRIAAPSPSESRSFALWKRLGSFSAKQDLRDFSAVELRVRGRSQTSYSQQENRFKLHDLRLLRMKCRSACPAWRTSPRRDGLTVRLFAAPLDAVIWHGRGRGDGGRSPGHQ